MEFILGDDPSCEYRSENDSLWYDNNAVNC